MSMKNSPTLIDRKHPLSISIKERYALTQPGSSKQTFHIVLDTSSHPISFRVGDSVGVYAQNDPILVDHIIAALKASGHEKIVDKRSLETFSLRDFLLYKANLARITSSFLHLFYNYETSGEKKQTLDELLKHKERLTSYLSERDPLDLFQEYKDTQLPIQELCDQFGPLLPRFYSIASSPTHYPNELHLTVSIFTFSHHGEIRYGVASHFLCSLAHVGVTKIPIYIQANPHFTLPSNPEVPIILIGPGTGIAPFRAFLQERILSGSKGKNWLFFGERNRATDYFYEKELEEYRSSGKLDLDLAFSRDQSEKIYVQHRMLEQGKKLWQWLEEGAYFYVCGDADQMAKEVDEALHTVCQKEGGLSPEKAKEYIKNLRHTKRYLTDVY